MKKIIQCVTFLILCHSSRSFAQFNTNWAVEYQHTTSSDFSNEGRKVITDGSGNIYVLADVTSDIDPNGVQTTSTFHYTVISKYSSTGALLITKNLNVIDHNVSGFDNKGAFGMEMDAAGNIYIGNIIYDGTTDFDVNITKYNSSLVRLWVRKFNTAGSDLGIDMGVSPAGVVYAVVKSVSGANTEYHIIKANAQVTNDTAAYTFLPNTDVLNAIWVEGNMVYVTGYHIPSTFKVVLTAKVNGAQGTLKWKKTYNGGNAGDDFGTDITVGIDGEVYVTGTSDQGAPTGNDALIMKLQSSNGVRIWKSFRDLDNSPDDAGQSIISIDANYVYVGSTSNTNVILDQVDAAFGIAGGRIYHEPLPDEQYSLLNGVTLSDFKISVNYGFYFTGSILATDSSNRLFSASYLMKFIVADSTERHAYIMDAAMPFEGDYFNSFSGISLALDYSNNNVIWLTNEFSDYVSHVDEKINILNLDVVPQIRKSDSEDNAMVNEGTISIEPNPSNDFVTVSTGTKITKIELFNLTGKIVKSFTANSTKVKMAVSDLMNGIYIGKIYSETGTVTAKKIIKN